MNYKFYNVRERADGNFNLCPLCDAKLKSCHLGSYCGNENCGYVDGIAALIPEEAEKIKDKLE